jgi:hypothetical protein
MHGLWMPPLYFMSTTLGEALVQEETRKRWLDLCAEAAICEDPDRLQELADTINAAVKQEKQRLGAVQVGRVRVAP